MAAVDPSGDPPLPDSSGIVEPRQWVWLARVRRPQGRKGEVFADILTDFPEKFAERHRPGCWPIVLRLYLAAPPPRARWRC